MPKVTTPRRVCLFTGISGTLGRDFAERHAADYDLVGVYASTPPAGPHVPLGATGRRTEGAVFALRCDLSAPGGVDEVVDKVLERFGSVDLLVNAAVFRRYGEVRRRKFADSLIWQFYLNVCVPMELASGLTRRSWRHLADENRARRRNVVNLSSTAGHRLYPGRGQSGYGATKAALDTATWHLASELAEFGVRANAVAPNTFPAIVPTQAVSAAVRLYDGNERTGEVLVLDADGERLLAHDVAR